MMPSKQFSQSEKCNCIFQLIKPKHNKAFILPQPPPSLSTPPTHSLHFKRGNMKTQASAKCKINILLSFLCFYGHHQESLCMYGTDESMAAWSVHKCGAAQIQWEFKACLFRGPLCSPPSSLFWVSWEDLEIVISGQSGWLICSGPVSLVIAVNPLNHVSTC